MNDNDKPRLAALLTGLAELYQYTISPTVLELFWRALHEWSLASIQLGLERHVLHPERGRFMPKPADVIARLETEHIDQAEQAWRSVLGAIASVGAYESVVFDDACIHDVIESMGGWVDLCHTPREAMVWKARTFIRRYHDKKTLGVSQPRTPPPLKGLLTSGTPRRIMASPVINNAPHVTRETS